MSLRLPIDPHDDDLEARLDYLTLLMCTASDRATRVWAESELRRLHPKRSSERIRQMEVERGLR